MAALARRAQFPAQVGEVAFQQGTINLINLIDPVDTGCGKELGESGDG